VQQKILTGVDPNGSAADGTITWNFGYGWGYGNTVPGGAYDFQSTAMHEMLHTFGFISVIDSAGNNTVENWTTFDQHVVDSSGTSVFNGTTFKTSDNSKLTGGAGSLFFKTSDGTLVALYTPTTWSPGSSMSHTDDNTYTGNAELLMNATSDTGTGVRELSSYEIKIMSTLGYTMVSQSTGAAVLFLGMALYRRRRKTTVELRVAR